MADSNTTKKALASTLKDLMESKPFEKISVRDICEKCNMNRKSFYYHFKDKYDLVNWIFDTEFSEIVYKKTYEDEWDFLNDICQFFYDNRTFYRKALRIKGQNSFSDHFRTLLQIAISNRLQEVFHIKEAEEFPIVFLADAFVMAFHRWILEYNSMTPSEFIEQIKTSIKYLTTSL